MFRLNDIPNNKRRLKLANFLEGYGNRIQLSAFEDFLSLDEMRHLYAKVQKQVQPNEDNVRFYWISEETVSRVLTIGSDMPQSSPKYYII